MTVKDLIEKAPLTACALPDPEREISGAYIGDLLSWVMGRAGDGCAWITIMSNINVAAVAVLADVACVILAENVSPDDDMLKAAEDKGINLLISPLPAYETAAILHGMGI